MYPVGMGSEPLGKHQCMEDSCQDWKTNKIKDCQPTLVSHVSSSRYIHDPFRRWDRGGLWMLMRSASWSYHFKHTTILRLIRCERLEWLKQSQSLKPTWGWSLTPSVILTGVRPLRTYSQVMQVGSLDSTTHDVLSAIVAPGSMIVDHVQRNPQITG
jgi:hypothetical protein